MARGGAVPQAIPFRCHSGLNKYYLIALATLVCMATRGFFVIVVCVYIGCGHNY